MKHLRKVLTMATALLLLCAVFTYKPAPTAEAAANKVLITQNFKITSSVQGIIKQTYKTTITGQIKNDNKTAYQDIVITLNVKTNNLGKTGQLFVNITALSAGQTYTINEVQDTDENFETVTSYSATASGAALTLSLPLSSRTDGLGGGVIAGIVIGIVAVIVIVFVIIKINADIKKGKRRWRWGTTKESASNATVINNITVAAPSAPAPAASAPTVLMKCPYCSAKNNVAAGKCSNCGAQL